MNKVYITLLLLVSHSLVAQERNFKRFRVGISQNYISALIEAKSSVPLLTNTSNAVVIVCLEPVFRINDTWLVGLRYEAYLRKAVVKSTGGNVAYVNFDFLY